MKIVAIINIEDSVIGSMHQVVVEQSDSPWYIRVDGHLLNPMHPFCNAVFKLLLEWEDNFVGVTDKEEMMDS